MTATASDDIPEEWGMTDEIHVAVYKMVMDMQAVAEHNALVFFCDDLLLAHRSGRVALDANDRDALQAFIDQAVDTNEIVQKYLGPNYVQQYIEQLEGDDDE